MGTKVQCESYFPGYFSMRDLNEDSNSCSWPLFYGDKTFTNGQYYNDYLPRVVADAYPANDKDVVKRTMLKHEAIFRKQVCLILSQSDVYSIYLFATNLKVSFFLLLSSSKIFTVYTEYKGT
jgi:hypothetical protein